MFRFLKKRSVKVIVVRDTKL